MNLFVDLFEKGSDEAFVEEVNIGAIIKAIVDFVKDLLKNEFGFEL